MSSPNRFANDMSRMFTGAMGVAQGAKDEAENSFRAFVEKFMNDQGYVTRDEFNAVAEMAKNARREVDELRAEIEAMKPQKTRAKK